MAMVMFVLKKIVCHYLYFQTCLTVGIVSKERKTTGALSSANLAHTDCFAGTVASQTRSSGQS